MIGYKYHKCLINGMMIADSASGLLSQGKLEERKPLLLLFSEAAMSMILGSAE